MTTAGIRVGGHSPLGCRRLDVVAIDVEVVKRAATHVHKTQNTCADSATLENGCILARALDRQTRTEIKLCDLVRPGRDKNDLPTIVFDAPGIERRLDSRCVVRHAVTFGSVVPHINHAISTTHQRATGLLDSRRRLHWIRLHPWRHASQSQRYPKGKSQRSQKNKPSHVPPPSLGP